MRNLFHWPSGQGLQRNLYKCSREIGNTCGSLHAMQDKPEIQVWRDPWQNQWGQIKTCVYFRSQWIRKTAYGRIIAESFILCEIYMVIFARTIMGKAIWDNPIAARLGKGFQCKMLIRTPWKRIILICVCGWHKTSWKNKILIRCGN